MTRHDTASIDSLFDIFSTVFDFDSATAEGRIWQYPVLFAGVAAEWRTFHSVLYIMKALKLHIQPERSWTYVDLLFACCDLRLVRNDYRTSWNK